MKISKGIKVFSLLLIAAFSISVTVSAQQAQPAQEKQEEVTKNPDGSYSSTKYDEASRPEDSYLAKFHAHDVVEKLMKKNLEQIYLLKVIVSNFKDKGWEGDYQKCYAGYKKAMELFYKRNIIYARVEFETNKKDISDLMKKISDDYTKATNDLLSDCATRVMLLHLDEKTRSDPNKNRELHHNQMRLRIAYGQLDDAMEAAVNKEYETSIYHTRVAKTYGIKIVEGLSKPDEVKAVEDKYKVHKADNLNRILNPDTAVKAGE